MLKLKKLKKYVALGLSCLIAINTTTVTFAQNSTSTQKYKSANNEISNNIIIKNSGVIIMELITQLLNLKVYLIMQY